MIASNQHGEPSITPHGRQGPTLSIPDIYLDLMFGDLPAIGANDAVPASDIEQPDRDLALSA